MKLYSYFRSSAAYRVRIALNLKHLAADIIPVNLLKSEQKDDAYTQLNTQGLVPSLQCDDGQVLTQSLAILEYLEEVYPTVSLLPSVPSERAVVRAMAQLIACDTHPLNNLRVLQYLTNTLQITDAAKQAWYIHWIHENFSALEKMLEKHAGNYCYKDTPTIADCCLVPQVYNARRFNVDLSAYPNIVRIADYCNTQPEFIAALPENQPDAPVV